MDEITRLGAAELARRIRFGDTSPLEVVDAHIARIEEVEPRVNALITTTFDAARRTARRLTGAGTPADQRIDHTGLAGDAGSTFRTSPGRMRGLIQLTADASGATAVSTRMRSKGSLRSQRSPDCIETTQ